MPHEAVLCTERKLVGNCSNDLDEAAALHFSNIYANITVAFVLQIDKVGFHDILKFPLVLFLHQNLNRDGARITDTATACTALTLQLLLPCRLRKALSKQVCLMYDRVSAQIRNFVELLASGIYIVLL